MFILRSATQQLTEVYDMDEGRVCGKAEFNAIFLRLRWKLENFNEIRGLGPVQVYTIQSGLMNLMLLKNFMFP